MQPELCGFESQLNYHNRDDEFAGINDFSPNQMYSHEQQQISMNQFYNHDSINYHQIRSVSDMDGFEYNHNNDFYLELD